MGTALLTRHHKGLRNLSARFLAEVARLQSAAYHWLLQLLTDSLPLADSSHACCGDFYAVFANTVKDFGRQSLEVHALAVLQHDTATFQKALHGLLIYWSVVNAQVLQTTPPMHPQILYQGCSANLGLNTTLLNAEAETAARASSALLRLRSRMRKTLNARTCRLMLTLLCAAACTTSCALQCCQLLPSPTALQQI